VKLKHVPNERKKEFGQLVNSVKQAAEEKFNALQENYNTNSLQIKHRLI
jgi:phenylalanyl-tRNA synthetase alpha chain